MPKDTGLINYNDVIMGAMASQITSITSVCSVVYSMRRSRKTSKLRVTGLCVGNSPVTGEFPAQRTSNAEKVSIWWRHHVRSVPPQIYHTSNVDNALFDWKLWIIWNTIRKSHEYLYRISEYKAHDWIRIYLICENKTDLKTKFIPGYIKHEQNRTPLWKNCGLFFKI